MTPEHIPKKEFRCPVCLMEWSAPEVMANKGCGFCGNRLMPMLCMWHDGYVKVNWQDLRVLVTYARRYSAKFDMSKDSDVLAVKALNKIIDNLRKYIPKDGHPIMEPLLEKSIVEAQLKALQEAMKIKQLPPPKSEPVIDDGMVDLSPNADGKIESPFYKIIKPK